MIWRKPASAGDTQLAKRVLVIQLGGLGAFVQALAVARCIRDHHVGARITLLTTEANKELAEKAPYFDLVEADGKPTDPQAITALIKRLRTAKYDLVYDLEGSNRTSNYFQGLRPWPPKWSGPTPGASYVFPDHDRGQIHPLQRYERQLAAAGHMLAEPLQTDLSWVRAVMRDPPRLQPDFFGIRAPYVLLLPRGGDGERRWPEARYIDLARSLARRGVTPVVLGSTAERTIGAAIAKEETRAKNLVTRPDLFQCITLAERAEFAVGDDVDLMHLAAAAGAPGLVFLSAQGRAEAETPRGPGGVIAFTAASICDIPVEQVERQLRNCGVFHEAATA